MTLGTIFLSELVGTAMLILLGAGVVANTALNKSKGQNTGFLFVNFGWGFAVFCGVLVSARSGGHLNPAVTIGVAASGATEFVPGIPVNFASIATYIGAQMIGAILGAFLAYLAYKKQFDATEDGPTKLGVFATAPEVRSTGWNIVTEAIGTFVLVFVVLAFGRWNGAETAGSLGALGALAVAFLVFVIGTGLGGPTGYAINPARDLGPRIAHALIPMKNKGSNDWGYSWIPVVGPIIGGVLSGLLATPLMGAIG